MAQSTESNVSLPPEFGDTRALDEASRLALLAHCVSHGVNALLEKVDRYGGAGLSQHGLGRVTKGRILEAVREACSRAATASYCVGRPAEAQELFGEALRIAQRFGDRQAIEYIWFVMAGLDYVRGDFPRAISNADRALEVAPRGALSWLRDMSKIS